MTQKDNLKNFFISDLRRLDNKVKLPNNLLFQLLVLFRFVVTNPPFRAIFFYRILNNQFSKKNKISKIILIISFIVNKIHIPYKAVIGGGLFIPHADCIIINEGCSIGENVTILQGVTLGGNIFKEKNGRRSPLIGNNVLIGAGAKVLGPISIGNNSMIGANAVVVKDIPENSVAVGIPAKVIKKVDKSFIELEMEFNNKNSIKKHK